MIIGVDVLVGPRSVSNNSVQEKHGDLTVVLPWESGKHGKVIVGI